MNRITNHERTKLNQEIHRKLISGQSTGASVAVLRLFLGIASRFYSIVSGLRNLLYSKGVLKTYHANAVVISIGNITAGGTGKTPLVIWLCRFLQNKNIPCAILTRGYKTHAEKRATSISTGHLAVEHRASRTDEPAILTKSCPEAKVIINPDRVAGAAEAVNPVRNSIGVKGEQCGEVSNGVNKFGAKALIMDDGFQHRRLGRDLDIVAIDAMCPFGYGKLLPAGLLREAVAGLTRADAVVITRCDQTTEAQLGRLEEKLRLANPDMMIARAIHKPVCAKSAGNEEIGIDELKNKKIFAFCGIGNPNAFFRTIKGLGANLAGSKIYNDHYHYTDNCLADIYEQARYMKADLILTTQKDWTRIISDCQSPIVNCQDILWVYLVIELKFIAGEDKLKQLIENTLADKIAEN